jgi:hypothetical protein
MKTLRINIPIFIFSFLFSCVSTSASADDQGLVAWWKFEKNEKSKIWESIGRVEDSISGNYKYVKGVSGDAVRFDGFTTVVTRAAAKAVVLEGSFSVEAWVAVAAYPWNWCPIVAQEKDGQAGYYFGIGPKGEVGLSISLNGEWKTCVSRDRISLRKWTHIAASFNQNLGIKVYLNGKLSAELPVQGAIMQARDIDLLIGMNREKRTPSNPVRPQATLPAWYSFDGIIDEVKIYNRTLAQREFEKAFQSVQSASAPDIPQRVMPSGPAGPGRFGAYYTQLKYYEEWDNLWRIGPDADVVVQFDNSPIRVIFWRGTRYSPVWVMENGQWMADQSAESFTDEDGCFEHMLDAQCHFSHVRIIENTEARVVVHWRYIPVCVRQKFSQVDEKTGWPDCVDEYYTFYPDGIGIRKVIMYTSGEPLGPQETIVLCQPGTSPEDNVALDALTLVNLKGESHVYSWAKEMPDFSKGVKPESPVIQVVNLKSKAKPFLIFEPGCRMRVFNIELRKDISRFPWWNHWPEAQIPSDGRYCQAPDRPSHFSLAWGGPPVHKGEGLMCWSTWVYGTTERPAEELALLARSWAKAPEVKVNGDDYINKGYDLSQRAYVIESRNPGNHPAALDFEIAASADSPLVNCCLVIRGWGEKKVAIRINGQKIEKGKGFRVGNLRTLEEDDLVVWMNKVVTQATRILIQPERI